MRRRGSALKQQRVQSLAMMPSAARFLSLDELDPSTQFCADPEVCAMFVSECVFACMQMFNVCTWP